MAENERIYIGHRYVPLLMGEWIPSISYEGLSIVTSEGNSYTSKKRVPIGVSLQNEEYWVVTGNYNAQVEEYRQDVKRNTESVEVYNKEVEEYFINVVKDYNVLNNGNDTTVSLQNAVNNINGNTRSLFFPKGNYSFTGLNFNEINGLLIEGVSKEKTTLILSQALNEKLIFKGCQNITFKNLTIDVQDSLTLDKFIFTEGITNLNTRNIHFENCSFINLKNSKEQNGTITFWRNAYDISFERCDFLDINMAVKFDNNYIDGSDGTFRFNKCVFKGDSIKKGQQTIKFQGSGIRKSQSVYITECEFKFWDRGLAELYHLGSFTITLNTINNCKSLVDDDYTGIDPVEKALFWLDGTENAKSVFSNNSFSTIEGVAIYMEEVKNCIVNHNIFSNVIKRPKGIKTWSVDPIVTSKGDSVMIITGGCERILIDGNHFHNVNNILLVCRRLSPELIGAYYVGFIYFNNNILTNVKGVPITMMEKVEIVTCNGNTGSGNNTQPFISIIKANNYDGGEIRASGNDLINFTSLFKRPAGYGSGMFLNNMLKGTITNYFDIVNIGYGGYVAKNNYDGTGVLHDTTTP